MKNCYKTNLTLNVSVLSLPVIEENIDYVMRNPVIDLGIETGLKTKVQYFRCLANRQSKVHVDGRVKGDQLIYSSRWALNYSWGSPESEMVWVKTLAQMSSLKSINPGLDIKHGFWEKQDTVDIERVKIKDTFFLVRIDVPHYLDNQTHNIRHCLSLREDDINNHLTWEQAVSHFERYLIE